MALDHTRDISAGATRARFEGLWLVFSGVGRVLGFPMYFSGLVSWARGKLDLCGTTLISARRSHLQTL